MKTLAIATLFLGLASFAQAESSSRTLLDPTAFSSINNISFNGSGCPAGEGADYLFRGDILWLKFPDTQTAETGSGISFSASRRNCAATLNFMADDKSYALDSIAFYVDTQLPAAATALVNVSWFFQGQAQTGSFSDSVSGNYAGAWVNSFDSDAGADVWKPCGADRALTINSAIRISGRRDQKARAQWQIIGLRLKSKSCY